MTTRFADHLLEGDHASRPAASAVPTGTLYSCSTHSLIYQSDGSTTWATWATLGGGAGTPASTVTDETSWGITPAVGSDTEYARQGHTHGTPADPGSGGGGGLPLDVAAGVGSGDLFAGTSLDGGWTSLQTTAVTAVDRSIANFLILRNTGNTSGLDRGLQRAFSPAGDFTVYCKINSTTQNANFQWCGVFAGATDPSDGGSGARVESFVVFNGGVIHWKFSKFAGGSETSIFDVTAPINAPYAPIWLAVRRVGSTVSTGISFDGVLFAWSATTTTIAFTVDTCGLFMAEAASGNDLQSVFNYIVTQ